MDGQSTVYKDKIHIYNGNVTLRQCAEQNYLGLLALISNGKLPIIFNARGNVGFKVSSGTAEVVSHWFPSPAV
jgi:hypothetical protein